MASPGVVMDQIAKARADGERAGRAAGREAAFTDAAKEARARSWRPGSDDTKIAYLDMARFCEAMAKEAAAIRARAEAEG